MLRSLQGQGLPADRDSRLRSSALLSPSSHTTDHHNDKTAGVTNKCSVIADLEMHRSGHVTKLQRRPSTLALLMMKIVTEEEA